MDQQKPIEFVNFMSVNKSKYDSCDYYQSLKPEVVLFLAKAIEAGEVKLNKNGNIEVKGWINEPKGGGEKYIQLKYVREPKKGAQDAQALDVDLEDVPF